MLKIFGRLLGLKGEELKYDRELLLFTLIGAIIFIFLGFNHTENGAKFLYANKLNQVLLVKVEKDGISKADIDKINSEFKEIVPINVIEYDIADIKDNLQTYINNIKAQDKVYLNDLALKIEAINKNDNKEILVKELKTINIEDMLKEYSKEEIVKRNLMEVAQWQTNVFLSNIYFICGGLIGFSFIIISVVCEISLFGKKEKKSEGNIAEIEIDKLS
jgi:hypothetical protein